MFPSSREVVPVANRVDAGVVVGGDGVQGVAFLNVVDNPDRLGTGDLCSAAVGARTLWGLCGAATKAPGTSGRIDNVLPGRNFVPLLKRFHFLDLRHRDIEVPGDAGYRVAALHSVTDTRTAGPQPVRDHLVLALPE